MLIANESITRKPSRSRAHRRAGGGKRASRFKTHCKRRSLCAALGSPCKTRINCNGPRRTESDRAENLQGRMASVTNEGYTSGTISSRERTSYTFDSKSYRVALTNESDVVTAGVAQDTWSETSSVEFLADHHNHTGYTQTIRETKVENGNTLTVDYTFGHDEIAQRRHGNEADGTAVDKTHVFGHDGHGSVRVLYDLAGTAANIAQAFTFAAYGEMVALHDATASSLATDDRLSTIGYSGEHFDAKAQQQYLRARFYNPANGRFNRLDPFAGNMQDPQSLHKYAYVHGDPITGVDPSGEMLGVGVALVVAITVVVVATSSGCSCRKQTAPMPVAMPVNTRIPIVVYRSAKPASVPANFESQMKLSGFRSNLKLVNEFWSNYGVEFFIDHEEQLEENSDWYSLRAGGYRTHFYGYGEANEAIGELADKHPGKIVVLIVDEVTDEPETSGITHYERRGFAVASKHWVSTAHELGHVGIGLKHTNTTERGKYNIMTAGISDKVDSDSVDQVFATREQALTMQYELDQRFDNEK